MFLNPRTLHSLTAPTDVVLSLAAVRALEPNYAYPQPSPKDRTRGPSAEAPAGAAGACPKPLASCTGAPQRGSGRYCDGQRPTGEPCQHMAPARPRAVCDPMGTASLRAMSFARTSAARPAEGVGRPCSFRDRLPAAMTGHFFARPVASAVAS